MHIHSKRYSYVPTNERTQRLYDQICIRFDELMKEENARDSMKAKYLPKSYYIELLAREFSLSPSSVWSILNSRNKR